jgi:hypothetical protein
MTTLAEKLRAEPGIDVRRLKTGTRILVETGQHVYEMKVVLSGAGLVEISSTDPVLRRPTVGQLVGSLGPSGGEVEGWIGKDLFMVLRFRNGVYRSSPVLTAEVSGDDWHYAVF